MDMKLLESPTARIVSLYTGEWLALALSISLRMSQEMPVPRHWLQRRKRVGEW